MPGAPGFKAGGSLAGHDSADLGSLAQWQGENLPYHPISHIRLGRDGVCLVAEPQPVSKLVLPVPSPAWEGCHPGSR